MEYDNTNRGVLFVNNKRKSENSPHESGSIDIDGIECWISSWSDNQESPTKRSLKANPKENGDVQFVGEMIQVDQVSEKAPTWRGHLWLKPDSDNALDVIELSGWNRVTQTGAPLLSITAGAWTRDQLPPRTKSAVQREPGAPISRIASIAAPAPSPFASTSSDPFDDDLPF